MNLYRYLPTLLWVLPLLIVPVACGAAQPEGNGAEGQPPALTLESSALEPGGTVRVLYTCDGEDVSPPISWSEPPPGTESFVLFFDDPDAPGGTWIHWVLFNVPANARSLPEGVPPAQTVEGVGEQGLNGWGRGGYGGPCPPKGSTHDYVWRLYALDTMLDLGPGATQDYVEQAMDGHILAEGRFTARYGR